MLGTNPFGVLSDLVPPGLMQAYVLLMVLAVVAGTLFDVYHKRSARFFAQRRARARAAAQQRLGAAETAALVARTVAEVAVAGEFGKGKRRITHLLMFYGFLLYAVTSAVLIFVYPSEREPPLLLPLLWHAGALMIVSGGSWFFFFQRANVVYDGDSPFHLGRADWFIGPLLASALFALVWHFVQTAYGEPAATLLFFGIYIGFTTLLFVAVPWSKFAHMFYKPAMAFQRKVEEASGASDLPAPAPGPRAGS